VSILGGDCRLPLRERPLLRSGAPLPPIAGVEERRFLEADVHERGLHSGQYPSHAPLDDGAGDVAFVVSLDVKFSKYVAFDDAHSGLPDRGIDYDFACHFAVPAKGARFGEGSRAHFALRRWRAGFGAMCLS